jgi:hypothetical protein
MNTSPAQLDMTSQTAIFYCRAIQILIDSHIPFMVGGAFALQPYAGLIRDTKDFDIFVRPQDRDQVLKLYEEHGFKTEVTFEHWLAKAWCGDMFIDIIYSSGNGIARVDDEWFAHAPTAEVLGFQVLLCPPEETIWSKAFIMERERYDGADVAHLIHRSAERLDWQRLLRRFDGHWRVLFSHLILFGFIYPADRNLIPDWVMLRLTRYLLAEIETEPDEPLICRGTFLSRVQYVMDIEEWGYEDARTAPTGTMTREEAAAWTDAAK